MKPPSRLRIFGTTLVAIVLIGCLWGFFALMTLQNDEEPVRYPKAVLLIRHAEEPPKAEASRHLSETGKKRAEALYNLFEKSENRPEPYPMPDFLIAPNPTAKSRRSLETLEPLAKRLDLPVSTDLEREEVEKLAQSILTEPKYAGKTILISWNHSMLGPLARALKVGKLTMEWKESQYNRIWVIRYGPDGTAEFNDYPQSLMPGDMAK